MNPCLGFFILRVQTRIPTHHKRPFLSDAPISVNKTATAYYPGDCDSLRLELQ